MIEGVKLVKLVTHGDERGFFRELFRFPEQFPDVPVGQLSHSLVNEGVIKGWHGHVYQSQWNYIVTGQLHVVLYDDRKSSRTYQKQMEFLVGEPDDPLAYFFPPGVLHGYKCLKGTVQIIYVTSGVYDLEDEVRVEFKKIDSNLVSKNG